MYIRIVRYNKLKKTNKLFPLQFHSFYSMPILECMQEPCRKSANLLLGGLGGMCFKLVIHFHSDLNI